jgi:Spy/CpxP family protein refolding chaperone
MSHMPVAALNWLLLTGPVLAQHQHGPQPTPYAGLERRAIKALSDEQIADLRAGRGMGLALVAELNGYPGPIHVLEHAQALGLSPEQRARVQALYEAMRGEAAPLGARLIQQETDLDRVFAERTVTQASLDRATAEIGRTQAALRAAHLKYHLAMMHVLTPAQVGRYAELRGYRPGGAPVDGHGGHGKH